MMVIMSDLAEAEGTGEEGGDALAIRAGDGAKPKTPANCTSARPSS